MNIERLITLREYIKKHRDSFDYNTFLHINHTTSFKQLKNGNWCGSMACVAGMASVLFTPAEPPGTYSIATCAANELGFGCCEDATQAKINDDISEFLFFPHCMRTITPWLRDAYDDVTLRNFDEDTDAAHEKALFNEAIQRLTWLIDGKNVNDYQESDSPYMDFYNGLASNYK